MSLSDSVWESSKQPFIKAKEEFIFEWKIYEKRTGVGGGGGGVGAGEEGSINSRKSLGISRNFKSVLTLAMIQAFGESQIK